MIYAQPQDVKISDYNQNGIEDITVKFNRQEVLESLENGNIEVSITGLVGNQFFQESDTIRVIGNPQYNWSMTKQNHKPHVPFIRPGGRGM
jgi:hypothetical protein